MNQLTLRGLDEALEHKLRALAQEKSISLNKAALLLMREGAGLTSTTKTHVVGNSLDEVIGTWTKEDEQTFLKTQAVFQTVDEDLW